jgi:uncharacterized membrane protein YdfJ with MMPL/SSD domain
MSRPGTLDEIYSAIARVVVRFRWVTVVLWLAIAVVTTGALPSLANEVNDNNSAFLSNTAPSTRAANLAAPLIGGGAASNIADVAIVAVGTAPLGAADFAALRREAVLASHVGSVISVRALGISPDGEAAQLQVRVHLAINDVAKGKTLIDDLEATLPRAAAPPGLAFHLAGQVATLVANQASSNKSGNEVQLFSFLFIIALLLVVFRSVRRRS